MYPNQQGGNPGSPAQGQPQGQTGPFGVPLGPNGQPQLVAPQAGGQPVGPAGYPQQPAQGQPQQQSALDYARSLPQQNLPPFMQQQVQQQVQQQATTLDDNVVLQGAHVPAELQGRTWAEAKQIYQGLRDVVIRTAQQPAQQAPQQPMYQPPIAQQQPQAQQPTQNDAQAFWRDPLSAIDQRVARGMQQVIQETLMPALQPMMQSTQVQQLQSVRNQMVNEFPDYAAHEPAVMASLRDADPRMLGNAELWRTAYFVAKGRAGVFQQQQQGQQAQANGHVQNPAQNFNRAPNGQFQPQQVQPGQNPIPNMNTFFSEQPGQTGVGNQQQVSLTPQQQYAAKMLFANSQNPEAEYAAWLGGMGR